MNDEKSTELLAGIAARRSCRAFENTPPGPELLASVLKYATFSPSAKTPSRGKPMSSPENASTPCARRWTKPFVRAGACPCTPGGKCPRGRPAPAN